MSFDVIAVDDKPLEDTDSLAAIRRLIEVNDLRAKITTVWPQPTRGQGDNIYNCY